MSPLNLKTILDTVRNQPDLQPHDGMTYCNIGLDRILGLCGVARMVNKLNGQPLCANDMCDYLRAANRWEQVNGDMACARASQGVLVVACQRGDSHGHVAAVYPEAEQYSGSWGKHVPMLNNIGKSNAVMRSSQCFHNEPDYYSIKIC